ncbi:hypothetical protein L210DRAFT_3573698, partial [Boletus edulis BED1]
VRQTARYEIMQVHIPTTLPLERQRPSGSACNARRTAQRVKGINERRPQQRRRCS